MLALLKKSVAISIILVLFVACTDSYMYYENQIVPNEKWDAKHPLTYVLNITDTLTPHNIGFTICYNDNYAYQNLYLFIYTSLPNGKQVIDTVSCDLFQADGKPWGKGNRIKELNVNYGTLLFPFKGKYVMKVKHAMRTDTVEGISSVGLFIAVKDSIN
ncbi:MAG: gliding motility lipoprotein GldH [Bacteroidales bacterium]|jgi:gliding motility-associated lipoprotein GldH|nr:gliding motility lipoprotein GldH [Bacteroidales bacterium]MDD4209327.1 gliding motility lipoprotein GldH [Bacteroidales bacterium]MDY0015945.1 gliding motility lipoprotein GldH [Bacteroidales bacterium]